MAVVDTVCVELTLRCPLRCLHCSANAAPDRHEMLDGDLLARRLSEVAPIRSVYLSGGEPFEHPSLIAISKHARSVASEVAVYSSGVLGTQDRRPLPHSAIAELVPVIDRIDISLYAFTASEHDSVTRTPGSFEMALESIRRMRMLGMPFGIHFVPVLGGEDLLEAAHFASVSGACRFHVLAIANQGRGQLVEPRYTETFLTKLRRLTGLRLDVEVIVSSALRDKVGAPPTARDKLRATFIDVEGYVYPGEGLRLPTMRSRDTLLLHPLYELFGQLAA